MIIFSLLHDFQPSIETQTINDYYPQQAILPPFFFTEFARTLTPLCHVLHNPSFRLAAQLVYHAHQA